MFISCQDEATWTQMFCLWERMNFCAPFSISHWTAPCSWPPYSVFHVLCAMLRFRRVPRCLFWPLRSSAPAVNARVTVVHACHLFRCLVLAPPLMALWSSGAPWEGDNAHATAFVIPPFGPEGVSVRKMQRINILKIPRGAWMTIWSPHNWETSGFYLEKNFFFNWNVYFKTAEGPQFIY